MFVLKRIKNLLVLRLIKILRRLRLFLGPNINFWQLQAMDKWKERKNIAQTFIISERIIRSLKHTKITCKWSFSSFMHKATFLWDFFLLCFEDFFYLERSQIMIIYFSDPRLEFFRNFFYACCWTLYGSCNKSSQLN